MPLISFIIPVYNVAPYIRECLDSILSQSEADYELCIVDDGSTDGSGTICDDYAARFPGKVKLRHQANQGVSVARNKCLDMSTGDYVWFVDGDDYILPDALDYLSRVLRQGVGDTIFFGNKKYSANCDIKTETGDKENFLVRRMSYLNPAIIFNRNIIEKNTIRFTPGMKMGEDLEFQYKYLIQCSSPVAIDFNFYFVREREGSASRNANSERANYESCQVLLSNMAKHLSLLNYKGISWMTPRLSERFKSMLRSASTLDSVKKSEVKRVYRDLIKSFKLLGYSQIDSGSLKIANISISAYYILYRLVLRLKSLIG